MVVEEPCYPDVRAIFSMTGATLASVPLDAEGVNVSQVSALRPDVAVVTPSHHCPTGVRMSDYRRRALLSAAADQDFLIVEDDYEPQLASASSQSGTNPALKSIDCLLYTSRCV